jgi:glutathione S-transferase
MKLYWCARTRSSRALWMLEESGVEYERVVVDIRQPVADRGAEFLAASPMGKVPALEDGQARMADSAAICLYLADRYAAGRLAPAIDDPERGQFLYWMFFTPGVIEPSLAEKAGGWTPQPSHHGWGSFDAMIQTLEAGLAPGPWLLGDRFTAADVMVGSSAAFMRMFKMLPSSPVIEAYADRCLARPAYQKAMAAES